MSLSTSPMSPVSPNCECPQYFFDRYGLIASLNKHLSKILEVFKFLRIKYDQTCKSDLIVWR